MATKSALPSHMKPASNGSEAVPDRHHGKSQSHVVSFVFASLKHVSGLGVAAAVLLCTGLSICERVGHYVSQEQEVVGMEQEVP